MVTIKILKSNVEGLTSNVSHFSNHEGLTYDFDPHH